MKRAIRSHTDSSEDIIMSPDIENIANQALNVGYNLIPGKDYDFSLKAIKYEDKLPKISIKKMVENGDYYYVPTLSFPTLTVSDTDFYDDIHHWVKEWERIARFITWLNTYHFNPLDYEDD